MLADMFFSPRIKIKRLAGLCRRSAIALGAGIDLRTVWAREAERATGRAARRRLESISRAVNRGQSMAEALHATGDFFPTLFRELVAVGEQTGHLAEVLTELAEHYERQLELRRTFLATIIWPLTELGLAVVIIGVLIWAMGLIEQMTGTRVDPLGLGLVGHRGLAIYVAFLGAVGLLFFLLCAAVRRGLLWTRPVQRGVLRMPVLGNALRTLALARLAWSLHLTLKAGMEVRRALRLSLQSARNAHFTDQIEQIDAEIDAGNSIYEAFFAAGGYPTDFLDAVAVGEQSGRLVESLGLLSRQYQDQARAATAVLTKLAAYAVWCVIALVLIALIFRLAMFYIGTLYDAMEM